MVRSSATRRSVKWVCFCVNQVIKAVLKDPEDDTQLSLLYANQSPDDILLLDELQELAKDPRFKVWYTGAASVHLSFCRSNLMLPKGSIPVADCIRVLCLCVK